MTSWLKRALFLLSLLFFFLPIISVHAASLYFFPAADNNWGNVNNWFLDLGFTQPAGGTPGVSDFAYVYGSVDTSLISSIEITALYMLSGTLSGSASFSVSDSARFYGSSQNATEFTTYGLHFNDSSSNISTITAQTVIFSGTSFNQGTLNVPQVEFIDSSQNSTGSTITGSAFFRDTAKNDGSADSLFFFDDSENLSSGSASSGEFHDRSINRSVTSGNFSQAAAFYDYSNHLGHIAGNAYFGCAAQNNGIVDGEISFASCDLYFYGNNTDWANPMNWWLDLNFTEQALRMPTSTDFVHIYSDVETVDTVDINSLTAYGTSTVQGGVFRVGSYAWFRDYSRLLPNSQVSGLNSSLTFDDHASGAQIRANVQSLIFNGDSELDNAPSSFSMISSTYSEPGCHTYINEFAFLNGRLFHPCARSPLNGTFGIGDVIPLHIYFNRNPNFLLSTDTGEIPTLKINTGSGTVDLPCTNCTTATSTWIFNYTVAEGDFSDDLSYFEPASLDTTGMNVQSNVGAGFLSLTWMPEQGERGSLVYENDIIVDGVRPTISSISSTPGQTSATITWNTSEAASSSVKYGLTNLYGSVSATSTGTLSHSITLTGLTPDTSYHFAISAFDSVQNSTTSDDYEFKTVSASVNETTSSGSVGYSGTFIPPPIIYRQGTMSPNSTTTISLPNDQYIPVVCEPYLTSYMSINQKNDTDQVKKLKQFLNDFEGEKLTVNGVFDTATLDAVKRFQVKNATTLSFWGLSKPTGFVYISTINRINTIVCQNKTGVTCPYFTAGDYISPQNRGIVVYKVAQFLNNTQGEHISLSLNKNEMIFTTEMLSAVKRFQLKNAAKILSPWNLSQPSGLWYQSTTKAANDSLGCFNPLRLDNGKVLE